MPNDLAVTASNGQPLTRARSRRRLLAALTVPALLGVGVATWRIVGRSGDSSAHDAPHFVDESTSAGIDHAYTGGFDYFVGGGVAAFDCNDDGRDELYFAGGSGPAALYRNDSPIGGALAFTATPSPVTDLTGVTGAYPLDVDSDGHLDLAVLRHGANELLRGLGDCRFEDATAALHLDGGDDWTVAFSATWEGSNSLPTLAFGSYLVPDSTDCADSRLLRPADGDGYAAAIPLTPGYCTLSILFSDWGHTGQRDLRMANDRHYYLDGQEQLWRITSGQPPRQYTEADGWKPLQTWGMGLASQDLTGDGRPEVFVTSQGDDKLQTLDDGATGPAYHDIALERGVTSQRPYTGGDILPSTAWHAQFDDVNNDGLADLFISKGNVEAQVDNATRDPSDLLIQRPGGKFVEGAPDAGIVNYDRARGATLVDLNLDGQLDLVVVNRLANVKVWRNVGTGDATTPVPMGHWLGVRLAQPAPNVDAIGAWIEVEVGDRTVVRETTVGGGHAGGQLGWVHAGLGEATTAQVRVQWPDGETGPWMTVTADQFVTITRGEPQPVAWVPSG